MLAIVAAISLGNALSTILKRDETPNPVLGGAEPAIACALMSLVALVVGAVFITKGAKIDAGALLLMSIVFSNWKFERHSSLD